LPFKSAFQHCLKAFQDCQLEAGESVAALPLQGDGRCSTTTIAKSGSQPHLPLQTPFQHCLKAYQHCQLEAGESVAALPLQDYGRCSTATIADGGHP